MSVENVIVFWRKVQDDSSLRAKVSSKTNVSPAEPGGLVEIAEQAGCSCTADELIAADNVIRFWAQVAKDRNLQGQLETAKRMQANAAADEIVRVALEHGFAFTAEQMKVVTPTLMASGKPPDGELDEGSLANVSGGARPTNDLSVSLKTALGGGLDPNVRIGPGLVPTLRI